MISCISMFMFSVGGTILLETLIELKFLNSSQGKAKLEYGVRAPVFYRNLREQTGENGFLRLTYRNIVLFLQKSPKISGSLWEFTGKWNLGILYSSSLLLDCSQRMIAHVPLSLHVRVYMYIVMVTIMTILNGW